MTDRGVTPYTRRHPVSGTRTVPNSYTSKGRKGLSEGPPKTEEGEGEDKRV